MPYNPSDIISYAAGIIKVDKKKKSGVVRFALPVKIGEVRVGVEMTNLEEAI